MAQNGVDSVKESYGTMDKYERGRPEETEN